MVRHEQKNKCLFHRKHKDFWFLPTRMQTERLLSDPGCQNSESRCTGFKRVNRSGVEGREKHFKKCLVFQMCWRLESPACEGYCVLLAPRMLVDLHSGKWSNVIPGARKPQSSRRAKWYSWKAVKNRVALDQSNDDPAGRAEQLKESPGERWELLTATEGLHSFFFSPSLSQDSLGSTLMKTLLEILKKKERRSTNYWEG